MSNEAITWAYRQTITDGSKFTLVTLADFTDKDMVCWPSQAKIAELTGQGSRTVRRHLQLLEAAGYITRTARFDGQGHRDSDRYVLNLTDDQRPENPAVKTASGQIGHRSSVQANGAKPDRPPAKNVETTGHSGQVTPIEPPRTNSPNAVTQEPAQSPSFGAAKNRGRRLARDWNPDPADHRKLGYSDHEALSVLEEFHDYWCALAGPKAVKLDWQATWRNWLKNQNHRRRVGVGHGSNGHAQLTAAELMMLDSKR